MPIFFRDFETFSALDIGDVGAWRYAAHPSTGAWCCAYAVDDGPIKLWTPGSGIPEEFIEAGRNPAWLASAFNAEFERNIERHIMGPRYNFPLIPLERQRCTQAAALMHALPRRLESVALALKLPQQKDTAGAKVMKEFAVPRKPRPGEDPDGGPYWCDDPDKLQQLYAYCRQDVATEREVYRRLGFIPEAEQTVWRLDAQINDRGFPVDREVVDAMFEVVDAVRADLDTELADLTEGAVDRVTKRDKMIAWLASQGCTLKNAQKGTIAHALRRKGLTAEVRRALEVWQAGAHAAAAKPAKMREWMGGDDRVRGTLAYHGARTGRWSARGPQPQNLKRPLTDDLGAAIDTIKSGDLDLIRRTWPQPLAVVGDLGRAMICAPAGSRLIAADFSGIESRTNGWLAGDLRKVDLWARFDATGLPMS